MFFEYAAQMNGLISRQKGPNYKFYLLDEDDNGKILWEQATHSLMFSGENTMGIREYRLSPKNELRLLHTIVIPTDYLFGLNMIEVNNPICVYK